MGCDYYIDIYVKIEHTQGTCYIKLPCVRGYYCDCAWGIYEENEDEQPYWHTKEGKELRKKVEKFMLTPRPNVIIYSEKQYKSDFLREKYEPLIVKKIKETKRVIMRYEDSGKLRSLDDIITVTKFEVRYDPGHDDDEEVLEPTTF